MFLLAHLSQRVKLTLLIRICLVSTICKLFTILTPFQVLHCPFQPSFPQSILGYRGFNFPQMDRSVLLLSKDRELRNISGRVFRTVLLKSQETRKVETWKTYMYCLYTKDINLLNAWASCVDLVFLYVTHRLKYGWEICLKNVHLS